jgi:plastocyanin
MRYFRSFAAAAALVAAAFLSAACSSGDAYPPAPVPIDKPAEPAGPKGTIRGRVVLKGEAPKPATDVITQDQKICGSEVPLPRIAVDSSNGVESTFVFLEGVPDSGPAPAPVKKSVLIDQENCQYIPHALIVPVGSSVDITNSDPILHNVHGKQDKGSGPQTVFNYAQPQQGARETLDTKLMKPGIVALSCEAGHPWMNAYLYVAKDPSFVTLTDKSGEFVIKNVPPGTYTIKMWHEGVQLTKINKTLQQYVYEPPYEISQQVTVTADSEATVHFDLTLRK